MGSGIGKYARYLLCLLVIFLLTTPLVCAKEVVRVGYFDQGKVPGSSSENFYGYMTEYLDKIAEYADIEYEYVYGNWVQCMNWLSSGKIDLMFPVEYTHERAAIFDYCKYDGGLGYSALYTNIDNTKFYYEDYSSFNGMRVGVLENLQNNRGFHEFSKVHNISVTEVTYRSNTQLAASLENHEVDAIVNGSMATTNNQKVLAKFELKPVYMITTKGNTSLLERLNNAAYNLTIDSPYYCGMIQEKYFGETMQSSTSVTREEAQAAQSIGTLRVVCDPDDFPYACYDKKTQSFDGLYPDYINLLAQRSGIPIEFIKTDTMQQSLDMMRNGEADILMAIYPNDKMEKEYQLEFFPSFSDKRYYLLKKLKTDITMQSDFTVAVAQNNKEKEYYLRDTYPTWNIVIYPTENDCIDAVKKNAVNAMLIDATIAQSYSSTNTYKGLELLPGKEISIPVSMSVRGSLPPAVQSFLKKQAQTVSDKEVESLFTDNAVNALHKTSHIPYLGPIIAIGTILCVAILVFVIIMLKAREKHYKKVASTDEMTGFYIRKKFIQLGDRILSDHKDTEYSILCIDIQKFRNINITFGWATGDYILNQVAENIQQVFPDALLCGRFMADKFTILLKTTPKLAEQCQLLSQIRYALSENTPKTFRVQLNIGIRDISPTDTDLTTATYIDQANFCKLSIKGIYGKPVAYFTSEMANAAAREDYIESTMEDALENYKFVVHYQPKYDLKSEHVIGAEALVRWVQEDGSLLSPDEFLSLFEKNGFILKLDFYVFEQVFKMLRERLDSHKIVMPIAMNVSRVHIGTQDFIPKMRELLHRYSIPPTMVEIEITETALGENDELAIEFLTEVKRIGVSIAIDDFGSGYSSFNLLKGLPVDVLKIDRHFIDKSENTERSRIIIRKIIEMAKDLSIKTICEGVETLEQSKHLKEVDCDMAQGFLYARPMPADALFEMTDWKE